MPNRTEEVASKVMGAVKATKATIEGLSGVFKKLAQEHGEVSAMLMRVKMSSDVDVRRDMFPRIRAELLSHETGELREVYPVFRQHTELKAIAEDHDTEASELRQMLEQLSALPYEDGAWKETFDKLVELVSHHVKEEENEYFPTATRVLGKDETEQMLTRYESTKAQAMGQVS